MERFSIGFGKAIWRRLGKDGTEYVLALIPWVATSRCWTAGSTISSRAREQYAFNHKSVWARMAIVAAGPMANFVFALFAFWLMFRSASRASNPWWARCAPASIVAQAGIRPGMEIVGVGGEETG